VCVGGGGLQCDYRPMNMISLETNPSQVWKIPIILNKILPEEKPWRRANTNYNFSVNQLASLTFGPQNLLG
jgi:hypothetical protein